MSSRATDLGPARPQPGARRWLRRLATGTTVVGVMLAGAPLGGDPPGSRQEPRPTAGTSALTLVAAHPGRHRWRGHPGRYIRLYTVRRGDTATGLAVRFHAWTDELIALNRLSSHAALYVGERLRIPVVAAAARRARRHRAHRHGTHHPRSRPPRAHHPAPRHVAPHRSPYGWRQADASRATVRRVVTRAAQLQGVPPALALAIAWQESGWQQHRISSAGAIGVMQVMPDTGRWVSLLVGHRLHLRRLHQNVTAGVMLLRLLRSEAHGRKAVAGYYQGLTSVRRYGMYPATRRYVADVLAVRRRLGQGWNPA